MFDRQIIAPKDEEEMEDFHDYDEKSIQSSTPSSTTTKTTKTRTTKKNRKRSRRLLPQSSKRMRLSSPYHRLRTLRRKICRRNR